MQSVSCTLDSRIIVPPIVNLLKIFHPGQCHPPPPIINFEKLFACVGTKDGKMYLSITTALLNITKGSNPPIINSNQRFQPSQLFHTPPPIIRESRVVFTY